jgi:hypothetical protein
VARPFQTMRGARLCWLPLAALLLTGTAPAGATVY